MKKFFLILLLLTISSCLSSLYKQEAIKSGKAAAASGRINSTEGNSRDVLKDLD